MLHRSAVNPKPVLYNDEQSRSGWGDHKNHQLQLVICIDGNLSVQYFPNRHYWLHSESAGDRSRGRTSAYHSALDVCVLRAFTGFFFLFLNVQHTLPDIIISQNFFIKRASSSVVTRNKHGEQLHNPAIRFCTTHFRDAIMVTLSYSAITNKRETRQQFNHLMGNLQSCHQHRNPCNQSCC